MPKGAKGRRGQGWPYGASTGWSQTCGFWGKQTQPNLINIDDTNGFIPQNSLIKVPWDTNKWDVRALCGAIYTPSYCYDYLSFGGNYAIDIFGALAQGVWSSSVVIEVYYLTAGTPSKSLTVGPYGATNPTSQTVTKTVPTNTCLGTTPAWTLTVYDDGTFTLV